MHVDECIMKNNMNLFSRISNVIFHINFHHRPPPDDVVDIPTRTRSVIAVNMYTHWFLSFNK